LQTIKRLVCKPQLISVTLAILLPLEHNRIWVNLRCASWRKLSLDGFTPAELTKQRSSNVWVRGGFYIGRVFLTLLQAVS